MRYEIEAQTRTRTVAEITAILEEAKLNFEEGKKTGKYVWPPETSHLNWRAGEAYNKMESYISDLERELELPYDTGQNYED